MQIDRPDLKPIIKCMLDNTYGPTIGIWLHSAHGIDKEIYRPWIAGGKKFTLGDNKDKHGVNAVKIPVKFFTGSVGDLREVLHALVDNIMDRIIEEYPPLPDVRGIDMETEEI